MTALSCIQNTERVQIIMPQHDLYANFKRLLEEYGEEIRTDLNLAILETSNDTLRNLKAVSPVLTGSYRKGWSKKMETTRWDSSSVVFYNKTDWQLTHLLNTGHAKRGGGRVPGDGHIDRAEEYACDLLEQKVEEKLKK